MNISKHILFLAVLLSPGLGAVAQTALEQEITVEHEVVPEKNNVARLGFLPEATLPKPTAKKLDYSTRNITLTVPGTITTLQPAAYADSLFGSPFRGYASLGAFPLYNAAANAGYKLVDNDHTRLAAFLQYTGKLYKGHVADSPNQYVRNHSGVADVTLHQAVGRKSFIDAGLELELARFNLPGAELRLAAQNMRNIGLDMRFTSKTHGIDYSVALRYSNFAFTNNTLNAFLPREPFNPVHENTFAMALAGSKKLRNASTVGADVEFSSVSNSRTTRHAFSEVTGGDVFSHAGGFSHGLLRLQPYYRLNTGAFRLDLGARIDFTFNSGKAFHIAPRALAAWKPSGMFTVYAKAGGGEHQNTLRRLFGEVPFAQTFMAYGNSHVPLTCDFGLTVGKIRNAYLTAEVGYARANNWLMPTVLPLPGAALTVMNGVNMRGFSWRAEAGCSLNGAFSAKIAYRGAPQGYNKGYYLWLDRAKGELSATVAFKPLKPLDVCAVFKLRHGRAVMDFRKSTDPLLPDFYSKTALGNIKMLNLNANYTFTKKLSLFASLNNILNSRPFAIGLVEEQGINGLIGASYKF